MEEFLSLLTKTSKLEKELNFEGNLLIQVDKLQQDYRSCVLNCRTLLDKIISEVFNLEIKPEAGKTFMIGKMIEALDNKKCLPKRIVSHARTVNSFGSDEMHGSYDVSQPEASAALHSLGEIMMWFLKEKRGVNVKILLKKLSNNEIVNIVLKTNGKRKLKNEVFHKKWWFTLLLAPVFVRQIWEYWPFKSHEERNVQVMNNQEMVVASKKTLNWESAYPNPEFKDKSGEVIKFEGRKEHSTVVVNRKMYVIGGSGKNDVRENDVWCLDNGKWELKTKDAESKFEGRCGHSSVYFDHKLWVIGGSTRPNPSSTIQKFTNDVCFSKDGKNWTCKIPEIPFEARAYHSSVVAPNSDGVPCMWVIGGIGHDEKTQIDELRNDVWFSKDGNIWERATQDAGFSPRDGHTSVYFKNKIWVIGGRAGNLLNHNQRVSNDVWVSDDGKFWDLVEVVNKFPIRMLHCSVVSRDPENHEDRMWVIGGLNDSSDSNIAYDDVWSSSDGENWTEWTNASFSKRWGASAVFLDGRLWIIGGDDSSQDRFHDVWRSEELLPEKKES